MKWLPEGAKLWQAVHFNWLEKWDWFLRIWGRSFMSDFHSCIFWASKFLVWCSEVVRLLRVKQGLPSTAQLNVWLAGIAANTIISKSETAFENVAFNLNFPGFPRYNVYSKGFFQPIYWQWWAELLVQTFEDIKLDRNEKKEKRVSVCLFVKYPFFYWCKSRTM